MTSVKHHKFATFGALILLAFFGIGVGVYKFTVVPQTEMNPFTSAQELKISRLATSGKVLEVAISPDGRYAAYVAVVSIDRASIRLRQIATSSDVEIVPPSTFPSTLMNLSFTPDGNYLYYLYNNWQQSEMTIYKVSLLGGSPTKIAEKTDGGGSVSPDGKTIAFNRYDGESTTLVLANADGSNERTIVKTPFNSNWIYCGGVPAWSPDGKMIACWTHFSDKDEKYFKLFGINVADGSQHLLSEQKWFLRLPSAVWMPDGSLIVSHNQKSDEQLAPSQLWLIAPNAAPKRITNDLNGYSGMSATAKGDVLATLQAKLVRNLWIAPDSDASRAKQVTSSGEIVAGVQWTPEGKLVFASSASGNADIWMMNDDGTNRKQLTANQGYNGGPSVTADGRYIVFYSNREDLFIGHIFRMDADGSNPKQLTNGTGEWSPRISPDGKWVYYVAHTSGNDPNTIYTISKS